MTPRERILAAVVGAIVLLVGLKFVGDRLTNAFQTRHAQIAHLRGEISQKNHELMLGHEAVETLADYEQRSLPAVPARAVSVYRAWLQQLMEDAGFQDINSNPQSQQSHRSADDVYHLLSINATGNATLEQLVTFLYHFYSVDLIHRIRVLNVGVPSATTRGNERREANRLSVRMDIDALALMSAPEDRNEVPELPSDRLDGELANYLRDIVQRNMFAEANRPPEFGRLATGRVYVGQDNALTVPATDPDGNRLTWRLEEPYDESVVRLTNPSRGEFQVRPQTEGEIRFTVAVTDDGVPPMSARQEVVVRAEPPPPEQPRPEVDLRQFAYLTAITERNGERLAWFSLRTEGRVVKLLEGEPLTIGRWRGMVKQIGQRDVELETADERLIVDLGKNLAQANLLPLGE